jgi:hypothetical protein
MAQSAISSTASSRAWLGKPLESVVELFLLLELFAAIEIELEALWQVSKAEAR